MKIIQYMDANIQMIYCAFLNAMNIKASKVIYGLSFCEWKSIAEVFDIFTSCTLLNNQSIIQIYNTIS